MDPGRKNLLIYLACHSSITSFPVFNICSYTKCQKHEHTNCVSETKMFMNSVQKRMAFTNSVPERKAFTNSVPEPERKAFMNSVLEQRFKTIIPVTRLESWPVSTMDRLVCLTSSGTDIDWLFRSVLITGNLEFRRI